MLSKGNTINLEDFRVRDGQRVSKVFTGRDRGKDVREKSKIDELESKFDSVNIVIPNNIYSINPSFFEEFLVNVVKKLGKEDFLKKFDFTSEGDYQFSDPLNQAIDRILKNKTALD
ncbi:MAG: DUF4325 domain-containing protein [Bacteroidales bacterium]